jgi:hypothetical protein
MSKIRENERFREKNRGFYPILAGYHHLSGAPARACKTGAIA